MLASRSEVTVGFFERLGNLGKGWIGVKKKGRTERPAPPEVEEEVADGPQEATAAPPEPAEAPPPPPEPKPDEPPTRVKKTL